MYDEMVLSHGDIAAFARRKDVRVIVNTPGKYTLSTRRNQRGNLREFACRAVEMTPYGVHFAAAIPGPIGDRVIAHVQHFGKLVGRIAGVGRDGFGVHLTDEENDQDGLAAKLLWYKQFLEAGIPDKRDADRFIPKHPLSTIMFGDGSRLTCFVIDISVTGVAVSADVVPPVGTPLAVGKVVGRVIRHFAEGFAVAFIEPQHPVYVERRVMAAQ
jgi:hypothetical protein